MSGPFESLLARYRREGALVDANLLLLLFIGSFRRELIVTFKRLKTFAVEDYETLSWLLHGFERIITTPNILTEVSNLSNGLTEQLRRDYFPHFGRLLTVTTMFQEEYVPSASLASSSEFARFGLTDAAIANLAKKYLVITVDFPLSQYLQSIGADALNFNHLRPLYWRSK